MFFLLWFCKMKKELQWFGQGRTTTHIKYGMRFLVSWCLSLMFCMSYKCFRSILPQTLITWNIMLNPVTKEFWESCFGFFQMFWWALAIYKRETCYTPFLNLFSHTFLILRTFYGAYLGHFVLRYSKQDLEGSLHWVDTGKVMIPIIIRNDTSFFPGHHSRGAACRLSPLLLEVVSLIEKALQYPWLRDPGIPM